MAETGPADTVVGRPRKTSDVVAHSPGCVPLRALYRWAQAEGATSWNQVESGFLDAMAAFDATLASTADAAGSTAVQHVAADLQNGKGDFFNDLLALLLERCSGVEHLYTRANVPGLVVPVHNLDGAYPGTGDLGFLLEAKMMGTPRHALNPQQKSPLGRRGSADAGKRVKELAFKSIDLKGEASRRRAIRGEAPVAGGAGGGDLTTWLHGSEPRIYFFLAARVISDSDFRAVLRWCSVAAQVVDAVGVFCYQPAGTASAGTASDGTASDGTAPGGTAPGGYEARGDVPVELQLERTLYKACLDLRRLR
ncbi:MAG: hypothetical protein ACRDY3_10330 [Acidimicrobiales bacterium]